jgi:hypothetical protein
MRPSAKIGDRVDKNHKMIISVHPDEEDGMGHIQTDQLLDMSDTALLHTGDVLHREEVAGRSGFMGRNSQ